jgi:type VI secretion system protein VasI
MHIRALAVAGTLIVSHAAYADTQVDIAKCAAESNSVERLECFDMLATKLGVASPRTETHGLGSWHIQESTSPIDDSKSVLMYVQADEYVPSNVGGGAVKPQLVIACSEKTVRFYIDWRVYLGIDDAMVTYRIDKGKAITRDWSISTDNRAAGIWDTQSSVPVIKTMFGRQQIVARVTPYGANPATVTFDISQIDAAIKPVRAACKW